ncbi:hypothetical protein EMQ25_09515 [Arsenicitalea aurantiaca]|uniref:DUF4760 domain-containing protein n=1 Tax=Arsenicitalea aurantiaca TaxID=1783274 RepID=A0A433XAL5_9HYPH|nr:hypothetical protein [Arsenicitalea aurantiaca]RUT31102.1 hypothetical protein EMQ25_09515 [Arsenicitalea aurantiaca]
MDWLGAWELASYVVTVVGLPLAIVIFVVEQRKQRANEEHEIQQLLADNYTDFLRLCLDNPDLRLLGSSVTPDPTEEKAERIRALYSILISLFERAYVLTHADRLNPRQQRYWLTWEDFMREWCEREDFRLMLPQLLQGEDPAFAAHMRRIAAEEAQRTRTVQAVS